MAVYLLAQPCVQHAELIDGLSKRLLAPFAPPPPPPPRGGGGWWPCWGVRRTPQHRATQPCSFCPPQEKILSISSPENSFSLSQSDSSSRALPLSHTRLGLSNRQGHPQGGLYDYTLRFRGAKRVQKNFQTHGLDL